MIVRALSLLIGTGMLFALVGCQTAPPVQEPDLIPREILFGNPEKVSPQVSPDGTKMAYIAPVDGVLNVWVGSIAGGDYAPVTHDTDRGIRGYFFAKDNVHLLYIQDKGGDENWRIYAVNLESGDIRDLTPFDEVQAQIIDVNKDFPGQILIGLNKRDVRFHDVYRLQLDTGEMELVEENPGNILGWLADSSAAKVSSFATRTRFVQNPEAPTHCRDCKLRDTCRYDAERIKARIIEGADEEWCNRVGPLIPPDNDLCVFNSDKDVPDHQVVNIEYENGVLAAFSAVMDQGRTNRTLHVQGTAGELIGDIGEDELELRCWDAGEAVGHIVERLTLTHDSSGHHGADSVIGEQFKSMLRGERVPPAAGLREGIEGCLVAFAAEASRHEERVVAMSELRKRVL